jgi:hypothetical protein
MTVSLCPGAGVGRLLRPNCAVTFMKPVNWNVQSLGGIGAAKPGVSPPGRRRRWATRATCRAAGPRGSRADSRRRAVRPSSGGPAPRAGPPAAAARSREAAAGRAAAPPAACRCCRSVSPPGGFGGSGGGGAGGWIVTCASAPDGSSTSAANASTRAPDSFRAGGVVRLRLARATHSLGPFYWMNAGELKEVKARANGLYSRPSHV